MARASISCSSSRSTTPMSVAKQVVLLCAANARLLMDVPDGQMEQFKDGLYTFIETEHPDICQEIADTGVLSDELKERILRAVRQYKSR